MMRVTFTWFPPGQELSLDRWLPLVPRVGEKVALSPELPVMEVTSVLWDFTDVQASGPSAEVYLK